MFIFEKSSNHSPLTLTFTNGKSWLTLDSNFMQFLLPWTEMKILFEIYPSLKSSLEEKLMKKFKWKLREQMNLS